MKHETHGGGYNVDGFPTSRVVNRVINRPLRHTQDYGDIYRDPSVLLYSDLEW